MSKSSKKKNLLKKLKERNEKIAEDLERSMQRAREFKKS